MTEEATEKVVEKVKPFLVKNWFWIVLALLILLGCFVYASGLWKQVKGGKKE